MDLKIYENRNRKLIEAGPCNGFYEDVQNFLKARERGIDVELFVRKNKDDK